MLAVGVLLPMGTVDVWLAGFMQREFGLRTGLLLTGTIVALIYAYLVRYFAVAWNGIEPAFARITPNMDAAARGLGAGTAGTLLRVHAPLLARTAAAAALLVFVDVMKELPATLVLRRSTSTPWRRGPTRSRTMSASPRPHCHRLRSSPLECCRS